MAGDKQGQPVNRNC